MTNLFMQEHKQQRSKIIYLGAFRSLHENYNVTYQDINGLRDIGGCMLKTNLVDYQIIIATPPCNYWSRANYRRETSTYAQQTKHLLPGILKKLIDLNKPFIVENVRNTTLYQENGLYDLSCFIYEYARHTYWTNIPFNPYGIKQKIDDTQNTTSKNRQGGYNVHQVIEQWLKVVTYENQTI